MNKQGCCSDNPISFFLNPVMILQNSTLINPKLKSEHTADIARAKVGWGGGYHWSACSCVKGTPGSQLANRSKINLMISSSGMGVRYGRGMETAVRKGKPTHSKLVSSLFYLLLTYQQLRSLFEPLWENIMKNQTNKGRHKERSKKCTKKMDLITKRRNINRKYERLRERKRKYAAENSYFVLHPTKLQAQPNRNFNCFNSSTIIFLKEVKLSL